MVQMRHDGIEQEIDVHDISVPVYKRSGWVVVTGEPEAAEVVAVQPDEDPAAAKGRRRTEKEN